MHRLARAKVSSGMGATYIAQWKQKYNVPAYVLLVLGAEQAEAVPAGRWSQSALLTYNSEDWVLNNPDGSPELFKDMSADAVAEQIRTYPRVPTLLEEAQRWPRYTVEGTRSETNRGQTPWQRDTAVTAVLVPAKQSPRS